jgi:hypothetical protein
VTSLASWFLFPLLAYALAAGLGLLAARIVRMPIPAGLVPALGFCLGVVITLPVYKLGVGAEVGAPLIAVLAVLGLVLCRRELRERLDPGWPALAGLAAFLLVLAPVILTGGWGWPGYNYVNDTATNMIMVDHVAAHGIQPTTAPPSTTTSLINGTLGARYPMGIHALLASVHGLLWFLPLEAVYQPFVAVLAGLAAMALAVLAMRASLPGPVAALAGALPIGGSLTYGYALHGSFKELALVMVLAAGAALARVALDSRLHAGAVALLGCVLAAGVVIYSSAAGPYVAVFALVMFAAAVLVPARARPRPLVLLRAAAAGAAGLLLAAAPGLGDALAFGRGAEGYYSETGAMVVGNTPAILGHLLRPLPAEQAIGIWPAGDYRVPLAGMSATVTAVLVVLALLLLAVAVVVELRRRRIAALIMLVPALIVYLVGSSRLAPYAEAKLLVLLTPAVLFTAVVGAWWVARRVPVAGALAGLALAGGVVVTDALAYHSVRMAPVDRLEALEDAFDRAPAGDEVLVGEWEEFAKYMGRRRRVNVAPETFSPRYIEMVVPGPSFARSFDTDEMTLRYVLSFPSVIVRSGPDTSRPPSGFRLAYRNSHYELWRRGDGPRAVEHLGLQGLLGLPRRDGRPRCGDVRAMADRVAPGQELLAAVRPPVIRFDYTDLPPAGWVPNGIPDTVTPQVPGRASGSVRLAAGRYRVWVRGTSGRGLEVELDGRRLGTVKGINTPGQWLPLGEEELSGGRHDVSLTRPGGNLAPGDAARGEVGPVAFERVGADRLVTVPAQQAERRLCGRSWDWIERVERER